MEDRITLDKSTLKALAVDSRLNILKLLSHKRYTLSDLSEELSLSKPTIKEHLTVLIEAKLIKKEDTLRKWKYYSLTIKGRKLIQPNEVKVFFAFVTTIIATFGFAFYGIFKFLNPLNNPATLFIAKSSVRSMATDEVIMNMAIQESGGVANTFAASAPMPESLLRTEPISPLQAILADPHMVLVFSISLLLLLISAFLLGYLMHRKTIIIRDSKN